ncbi:MAG: LIC11966 family surface protein [Bacteroidia bacterium]
MKKVLFAATAVVALLFTSCGPTQADAIKYNDKIVDLSDKVNDMSDKMADQLDGHDLDTLKAVYSKFSATIKSALAECEKMGALREEDKFYHDATLTHFRSMDKLVDNEVKRIVDATIKFSAPEAEPSDTEIEALNKDIDTYDTQTKKTMDGVKTAQKEFSKKWNFDLR